MNQETTNTPRFPWHSLFRLAMTQGLAPEQLWQMTPAEIIAGLDLPETAQIAEFTQDKLDRLLAQYGPMTGARDDHDRQ